MFITSPEKAARQILAAVRRNRRRALIGPDAKVIDLVSRLPATLYQHALVHGAGLGRRRASADPERPVDLPLQSKQSERQ